MAGRPYWSEQIRISLVSFEVFLRSDPWAGLLKVGQKLPLWARLPMAISMGGFNGSLQH